MVHANRSQRLNDPRGPGPQAIFQQAAELFARGLSVRQVKQALGISHSEAGRLRLRAAAEGLLGPGREDEREEAETVADEPYRLN
jgi:transposase-like protein